LPTANPVTSQTINYTCVAVGIVAIVSLSVWFLWAHKWFTGPRRQIQLEQAGVPIEAQEDPAVVEKVLGEKQITEL
jgi:hypothetical protein